MNFSHEINNPDYNRGYAMGFENGMRDEDRPWKELNDEEYRGYIVGFREGWVRAFGIKKAKKKGGKK